MYTKCSTDVAGACKCAVNVVEFMAAETLEFEKRVRVWFLNGECKLGLKVLEGMEILVARVSTVVEDVHRIFVLNPNLLEMFFCRFS